MRKANTAKGRDHFKILQARLLNKLENLHSHFLEFSLAAFMPFRFTPAFEIVAARDDTTNPKSRQINFHNRFSA